MSGEPLPEGLPPPPLPPPPRDMPTRQRRSRSFKAAVVALSLAGVGWLIWIYGWIAELDTGYPDGIACTGSAANSDAYRSCMHGSERAGAIAWALTLGLALTGLMALGRCRRGGSDGSDSRALTVVALVLSASLAVVATVSWIIGAQGGFYEDRIGATTWTSVNVAAILLGVTAGWVITLRIGRG